LNGFLPGKCGAGNLKIEFRLLSDRLALIFADARNVLVNRVYLRFNGIRQRVRRIRLLQARRNDPNGLYVDGTIEFDIEYSSQ
jgi:hypothetical protein